MGKTQPSKRELSEQKKKEEEHAAAQVIVIFNIYIYSNLIVSKIFLFICLSNLQAFEEFVATFQNEGKKSSKVWVKAGTYDAGKRRKK